MTAAPLILWLLYDNAVRRQSGSLNVRLYCNATNL